MKTRTAPWKGQIPQAQGPAVGPIRGTSLMAAQPIFQPPQFDPNQANPRGNQMTRLRPSLCSIGGQHLSNVIMLFL